MKRISKWSVIGSIFLITLHAGLLCYADSTEALATLTVSA